MTTETPAPMESEADELVRDMLSMLTAEQLLKEPLLPSDLAWMERARAYLKSRRRLVVESPEDVL